MSKRLIIIVSSLVIIAVVAFFVFMFFVEGPSNKGVVSPPQAAKTAKTVKAVPPKKQGEEEKKAGEAATEKDITKEIPVYKYAAAGRRDPFFPLVGKIEAERKPGTTPLESHELSAFKLIAILWNKRGNYAVITLPDGKSYTIKEGTKLGIFGGKVVKITKDSVVVRENVRDNRGVIKPKDTILKLRVEGKG